MDLRNRENFWQIVGDLKKVPSAKYREAAARITRIAEQDTKLDTEIANVLGYINQKEISRKTLANGSFHNLGCRMHVFHMDHMGHKVVRIDAAELPAMTQGEYHMSDFVSKIEVKVLPSNETVTWTRGEEAVDGVTVTRPNISKVEISVHVDYEHALFSVPTELRGDADVSFCNVTNIFKLICDHIKRHHLSSDDDPSYFTPDGVLHKLLYPNHPANHPVSFASLLDVIKSHFKRPGPFKIEYELKEPMKEKVSEIMVQVPHKFDPTLLKLISDNQKKLQEALSRIDGDIASCSADIGIVGCDVVFLDKIAANPVSQLLDIINKPTGVVKDVQSVGKIDYTNMATTCEFYKQPWAVPAAAFVVGGGKETHSEPTKTGGRRR